MEPTKKLHIACMGGVILDHCHFAQDRRVVGHTQLLGGVAVHIARYLKRRDMSVHVYSAVGKDTAGTFLKTQLQKEDLAATLFLGDKPSGEVTLVYGNAGELVATSFQTDLLDSLTRQDAQAWSKELKEHDAWILDTDLPQEFCEALIEYAPPDTPLFITTVTPEKTRRFPQDLTRFAGAFMNIQEFTYMTGFMPHTPQEMQEAADLFFKRGARTLFVTQGADGAWCLTPEKVFMEKAVPLKEPVTTTHGAGDAFSVGVILSLLQNERPDYALALKAGIKGAYNHLKEVNP